jgi:HTH-type transcriptional regulator / antitoxin HipB
MIIHSPKELALFVASHRKKLKLSQAATANASGKKKQKISAFEKKPESTKLDTLFQILSAVNLDLSLSPRYGTTTHKTKWKEEW